MILDGKKLKSDEETKTEFIKDRFDNYNDKEYIEESRDRDIIGGIIR